MRYGPPGAKRLVYFVDDMNMPFVDKYDTQSAIELIRQSVDYRGWFDKVRDPFIPVVLHVFHDIYVTSMVNVLSSFLGWVDKVRNMSSFRGLIDQVRVVLV